MCDSFIWRTTGRFLPDDSQLDYVPRAPFYCRCLCFKNRRRRFQAENAPPRLEFPVYPEAINRTRSSAYDTIAQERSSVITMSASTNPSVKSAVNFFNNLQSPSSTEKPFTRPKPLVKSKPFLADTSTSSNIKARTHVSKTKGLPSTIGWVASEVSNSNAESTMRLKGLNDDDTIINVRTVEDNGDTFHKVLINIENSNEEAFCFERDLNGVSATANFAIEKSEVVVQTVRSEAVGPVNSAQCSDESVYKRIDASLASLASVLR